MLSFWVFWVRTRAWWFPWQDCPCFWWWFSFTRLPSTSLRTLRSIHPVPPAFFLFRDWAWKWAHRSFFRLKHCVISFVDLISLWILSFCFIIKGIDLSWFFKPFNVADLFISTVDTFRPQVKIWEFIFPSVWSCLRIICVFGFLSDFLALIFAVFALTFID